MSEDPQSKKVEVVEILEKAIADGGVPKLYVNGFGLGLGNADIFILLQRFGQPIGVLSLSYTLAKTLSQKLGGVVAEFESAISQNILTTDRIDAAMKESRNSEDANEESETVRERGDKVDVH